jgi:hypothetical protein
VNRYLGEGRGLVTRFIGLEARGLAIRRHPRMSRLPVLPWPGRDTSSRCPLGRIGGAALGARNPSCRIPIDAPLHEVNGVSGQPENRYSGEGRSLVTLIFGLQDRGTPVVLAARGRSRRNRTLFRRFGDDVASHASTYGDPGGNRSSGEGRRVLTLLAPWTAAQPHQMLTGPCKSPRRESDPTSCLRSAAPASGRSRRWGGLRVSISP